MTKKGAYIQLSDFNFFIIYPHFSRELRQICEVVALEQKILVQFLTH